MPAWLVSRASSRGRGQLLALPGQVPALAGGRGTLDVDQVAVVDTPGGERSVADQLAQHDAELATKVSQTLVLATAPIAQCRHLQGKRFGVGRVECELRANQL